MYIAIENKRTTGSFFYNSITFDTNTLAFGEIRSHKSEAFLPNGRVSGEYKPWAYGYTLVRPENQATHNLLHDTGMRVDKPIWEFPKVVFRNGEEVYFITEEGEHIGHTPLFLWVARQTPKQIVMKGYSLSTNQLIQRKTFKCWNDFQGSHIGERIAYDHNHPDWHINGRFSFLVTREAHGKVIG